MNNKKFLAKVMVITMMAISLSLSAHARSLPTDDPGMGTPDGKVTDNVPATILSPIAVPGLPDPSTANFGSRSWTCHTTIALVNSGHSYVPEPWGMSGGILTDRAKRCKEYIQANWIDNGAIWK